MKLLIVLQYQFELWTAPAWFGERLRHDFPQVEVVHRNTYNRVEEQIHDAEVVITLSLRPEQFQVAKKLRWIHSPAAAVHQFLFPELVNSDVILTNGSAVHGPVVAEHVMALVFALAKRLPQAVRLQEKRIWARDAMWNEHPRPREIAGATLGLVGLGSIGREVAKRASGLGMRVLAVREHPGKGSPEGVAQVFASAQLETMLAQSDYVVLSPPVTPATRGLINAARLDVMKPDAYLINVGRGPLVDETALVQALRAKKIGGAALDVFEHEPLPHDSPLWEVENLLVTPHSAGLTEKMWERQYAVFSKNLRRFLAHEPLLFVVDKNKGY